MEIEVIIKEKDTKRYNDIEIFKNIEQYCQMLAIVLDLQREEIHNNINNGQIKFIYKKSETFKQNKLDKILKIKNKLGGLNNANI